MSTFTNTASLSYNGTTVVSNTTTGQIVEVVSATKTAVQSDYQGNSIVTYAVAVNNAGTSALSGLTLSDDLGAYPFGSTTLVPLDYQSGSLKYYVNGVLQTAPTPTSTSPLTVTGISIPAGGNALLLYSAQANQYAPLAADSTITNTATVSGTSLTAPITAEETIDAAAAPDLSISKSLCPTTVTGSGEIVYTITIENTGNTATSASDNVIVSDTFTPPLSSIAVTLNGTPLSSSDYTYDATTGVFSTTAGAVSVPAATYIQNASTGVWEVTPGVSTLVISGTV